MKQYVIILLSMFFIDAEAQHSNSIIIGTIDSIESKILNERRKVWVHVPDSDPKSLYSPDRYPVVYLLDGEGHFYSVMGMIQQLSEVNGNTVTPKMIIVGITNTDRMRDLTPTHVTSSPMGGGDMDKTSGGGENFTAFLQKELIPYIDSVYPTAPFRMLIGHSIGGLMVVNTLINHTELFNAYLAIDPSMWWDDQKLLKQAATVLKQKNFNGKSLFLGFANSMAPGMDTSTIMKDTAIPSLHMRSILQLASLVKNNPGNGLRSAYKYYPEDDHGSVPLIAEYDALRFMFSEYRIPFLQNLFEPGNTLNADSAVTAHFQNASRQLGYTVTPPEPLINELAYAFMQNKMQDKAFGFFNMNTRNYPKSSNVYDSMGDYYDANGDKIKAIEYYTKALALKEIPDTRKKLDKLKGAE